MLDLLPRSLQSIERGGVLREYAPARLPRGGLRHAVPLHEPAERVSERGASPVRRQREQLREATHIGAVEQLAGRSEGQYLDQRPDGARPQKWDGERELEMD